VPMRTCGSHTVGETFRISWSGDSSKAWQELLADRTRSVVRLQAHRQRNTGPRVLRVRPRLQLYGGIGGHDADGHRQGGHVLLDHCDDSMRRHVRSSTGSMRPPARRGRDRGLGSGGMAGGSSTSLPIWRRARGAANRCRRSRRWRWGGGADRCTVRHRARDQWRECRAMPCRAPGVEHTERAGLSRHASGGRGSNLVIASRTREVMKCSPAISPISPAACAFSPVKLKPYPGIRACCATDAHVIWLVGRMVAEARWRSSRCPVESASL